MNQDQKIHIDPDKLKIDPDSHAYSMHQHLSELLKKITKDLPYGVTVHQTNTGITVHFTIYDTEPNKIAPPAPDVIHL